MNALGFNETHLNQICFHIKHLLELPIEESIVFQSKKRERALHVHPLIYTYQNRKGLGRQQLHHPGNHFQTLTQVPLPFCLLL